MHVNPLLEKNSLKLCIPSWQQDSKVDTKSWTCRLTMNLLHTIKRRWQGWSSILDGLLVGEEIQKSWLSRNYKSDDVANPVWNLVAQRNSNHSLGNFSLLQAIIFPSSTPNTPGLRNQGFTCFWYNLCCDYIRNCYKKECFIAEREMHVEYACSFKKMRAPSSRATRELLALSLKVTTHCACTSYGSFSIGSQKHRQAFLSSACS